MEEYAQLTDEELLRRTEGDPEAFGVFYRHHVAAMLAYFRRRTGDTQVAFDLTAETFARALEHAGRFQGGPQPPAAWLYAIARNLLIDSQRRGRVEDDARRRLALEPMTVTELGFERVEAVADAARRFDAVELEGALSPNQAEAIYSRVLQDESYEQIATRLRCSPQVARQHVSRGLRILKRRYERNP